MSLINGSLFTKRQQSTGIGFCFEICISMQKAIAIGLAALETYKMNVLRSLAFSAIEGIKAHARRLYKGRQVVALQVSDALRTAGIVVICPICNEASRLAAFLDHYRGLAVDHFIFIDNGSTDTTLKLLRDEVDVSIFEARGLYSKSRYAVDWVNYVLSKYCVGKWILHVDADELLVFPHCETIRLPHLCRHLESEGCDSLNAALVDMYSDRAVDENICKPGQNPLEVCPLFDAFGYEKRYEPATKVTWIKGGVRGRVYFDGKLWDGPALNKTPLVLWKRSHAFLKSAHELWPWSLNEGAQSRLPIRGALLHFKFTSNFTDKIALESVRQQHTTEYTAYTKPELSKALVGPTTTAYVSSDSLLQCGLMEGRGWVHLPNNMTHRLSTRGKSKLPVIDQYQYRLALCGQFVSYLWSCARSKP